MRETYYQKISSYNSPKIQKNPQKNQKIRSFKEIQKILKNSLRNKSSLSLKSKFA